MSARREVASSPRQRAKRAWTEAQARAWLKASKPRGWWQRVYFDEAWVRSMGTVDEPDVWVAEIGLGYQTRIVERKPTLRAACLALVRAAKRAGVAVATVDEP